MSESTCPRCGGTVLRTEHDATTMERRVMGWKVGDGAPKSFVEYACRDCSFTERAKTGGPRDG